MELNAERDGENIIVTNETGNWLVFPIRSLRSTMLSINTDDIGGEHLLPSPQRERFLTEAWDTARAYAEDHNL